MNKRSVCVVAPVHAWDDVRVYQKEARTLADAGYRVSVIARAPSPQSIDGIEIIPSISDSRYRPVRFLLLPAVGVQALQQNADIYHLHDPELIPIGLRLKRLGKRVIFDAHEDVHRVAPGEQPQDPEGEEGAGDEEVVFQADHVRRPSSDGRSSPPR